MPTPSVEDSDITTAQSATPQDQSLRRSLWRLYTKLSRRRRIQLLAVAGLMLAGSLAEMFSLGTVVPFLAVLAEPDRIWSAPQVQAWAGLLGWRQASDLLVPSTLVFAGAAMLAGAVRLITLRASIGLANAIGSDLSIELYRRILYQPYAVHLRRNSSETISTVTNEVGAVVGLLNGMLQLCTSGLVSLAVAGFLLILNPVITASVAVIFIGGYAIIGIFSKRKIQRIGPSILVDQTRLIRSLQEGLGAIRDVILDGSQPGYIAVYGDADRRLRRHQGQGEFLLFAPRYAMEAAGLMVIAFAVLALSIAQDSSASLLPILGALALGAQRLLPAIQLIYAKWGLCRLNQPSLLSLLSYLDQSIPSIHKEPRPPSWIFKDCVQFKNIGFRYGPAQPWILRGVNLRINRGEWIGIVGESGCGKSTLVDILIGLLEPVEGEILVDGKSLDDSMRRRWQGAIAHVPQSIFLADLSIAQNIAFGVPSDQIDLERLKRAAKHAHIDGFINTLPLGYNTRVGERGTLLSGGQSQRLGIARALYRETSVLVFDEATSALDSETEEAVCESINSLPRDFTVVTIAHRKSTLKNCDRVICIANNKTFDELLAE